MNSNDLIWHFTSAGALYPILHPNGGLLATHQAFMNDPSDCQLSRRMSASLAKVIDAVLEIPAEEIINEFESFKQGLRLGTHHSIFLTCFSETFESPILWRCYTSRGGFAIGFSANELEQSMEPFEELCAMRFNRCSYSDWDQAQARVSEQERVFENRAYRMRAPDCNAEEKASIVMQSIKDELRLTKELAFFKSPFFGDEKEVRIMYSFNDPVPISKLIVLDEKPRIQIPLSVPLFSLVRRIVVSPLGNQDANYSLAQIVAASIGLPLSKVEVFNAPIR